MKNKNTIKKFILIIAVLFLAASSFAYSKIPLEEQNPGMLAVSYLQDARTIKAALANNSGEKQNLKVSYGYYDLKPVYVQIKDVEINTGEIVILSFKNIKLKTKEGAVKICDMIFINKNDAENGLITSVYVQRLHPSSNYYKCYNFLTNDYNYCKLLLNLNLKKEKNTFYVLRDKLSFAADKEYKAKIIVKPLLGLRQLSAKEMKNENFEKYYVDKISAEAKEGKLFTGYGYLLLKISFEKLSKPVLVSPRINEYMFREQGVSTGELTPPQILFYPQGYKIREL